MIAMALADSTGYGKIRGSRTQSVIGEEGTVFHIISPGSSLSAPGSKKNQRSLAHALAVETNPLLSEALEQDKHVKVIFMNGCQSVGSKQQKKYEQMTRYRKAMDLLETDFTIMSLQSLAFFFLSLLFTLLFFVGFCVHRAISTRENSFYIIGVFIKRLGQIFRIFTSLVTTFTSIRKSLSVRTTWLYLKQ